MTRKGNPDGIVLPVVLVILVLLELLAAGTLALAYQENSLARDRGQAQRAALAARSGSARVADAWAGLSYQAVPVGGLRTSITGSIDPFTDFSTTVERLAPDLFLIRAEGRSGPVRGTESRARTSFLIAAYDITQITAQFRAAVGVAGPLRLTDGAEIDGYAADDLPTGWASPRCANWLVPAGPSAGLTLGPGAVVDASSSSRIAGDPARNEDPGLADAETFARLGGLTLPTIQAIADRTESGVVRLGPQGGPAGCDLSAPGNWGAPLEPSHACGDYFPLIYSPGDLTISSGAGQGILVVDGNLTMGQGVQFFGVTLIRGRLVAGPGAELNGAVLIGSTDRVSVLHGARLRRCNCAVGRALTAAPGLNRPLARRGRSWVPAF